MKIGNRIRMMAWVVVFGVLGVPGMGRGESSEGTIGGTSTGSADTSTCDISSGNCGTQAGECGPDIKVDPKKCQSISAASTAPMAATETNSSISCLGGDGGSTKGPACGPLPLPPNSKLYVQTGPGSKKAGQKITKLNVNHGFCSNCDNSICEGQSSRTAPEIPCTLKEVATNGQFTYTCTPPQMPTLETHISAGTPGGKCVDSNAKPDADAPTVSFSSVCEDIIPPTLTIKNEKCDKVVLTNVPPDNKEKDCTGGCEVDWSALEKLIVTPGLKKWLKSAATNHVYLDPEFCTKSSPDIDKYQYLCEAPPYSPGLAGTAGAASAAGMAGFRIVPTNLAIDGKPSKKYAVTVKCDEIPSATLKVDVKPFKGGLVTTTDRVSIQCGTQAGAEQTKCEEQFGLGAVVELNQAPNTTPDSGGFYIFKEWVVADKAKAKYASTGMPIDCGTASKCTVILPKKKGESLQVEARFEHKYKLSLTVSGAGSGTVNPDPKPTGECKTGTCIYGDYTAATTGETKATVTAKPDPFNTTTWGAKSCERCKAGAKSCEVTFEKENICSLSFMSCGMQNIACCPGEVDKQCQKGYDARRESVALGCSPGNMCKLKLGARCTVGADCISDKCWSNAPAAGAAAPGTPGTAVMEPLTCQ